MLVAPSVDLAERIELILTTTGGWRVVKCQSQDDVDKHSSSHWDLLIVHQQALRFSVSLSPELPAIVLKESAEQLSYSGKLHVIDEILLNEKYLTALAEQVRLSYLANT